jgi:hypothetical protein
MCEIELPKAYVNAMLKAAMKSGILPVSSESKQKLRIVLKKAADKYFKKVSKKNNPVE